MSEKYIDLNESEIRALEVGGKSQLRRVLDPQPIYDTPKNSRDLKWICDGSEYKTLSSFKRYYAKKCPYGCVSDELYVREHFMFDGSLLRYYATDIDAYGIPSPPHSMKLVDCRFRLKVTSVKIEKLQDISREDLIAEGYHNILDYDILNLEQCREMFAFFWNLENNIANWEVNPWVWAVSFDSEFIKSN